MVETRAGVKKFPFRGRRVISAGQWSPGNGRLYARRTHHDVFVVGALMRSSARIAEAAPMNRGATNGFDERLWWVMRKWLLFKELSL